MQYKVEPPETMNASFNVSLEDQTFGIPDEFRFLLLGVYCVTCLAILLGNSMICYTTRKIPSFRTVTHFFIVSLAVTDIIMTVLCVPLSILSNLIFHYWPFWDFLCPLIGFLQLSSVLLRSFMLMAMTCDMYHITLKPLKPRLLTKSRAKLLVALICALSSLISLPVFFYSHIEYMPYEPGSRGLCMEIWPDDLVRSIYGIGIMMLQYFIPLIMMSVCYIHIGVIIWAKQTPGEANTRRDERQAVSKKKTIKMIVIVVLSYLLLWLPFHVITIIGDLDQSIFDSNLVHIMWLIAHWLAFSNSGVNPMIVFWMNSNVRQNVQFCLHGRCCCPGKQNTRTISRDSFALASYRRNQDYPKTGDNQLNTAMPVTSMNE
ncbi:RYamide receptor-like [Ylistrum balloti]|uniref:RYamide receptor-like n=1 Tax=Ylistrum balloti TaxID=509963 RepID=UPI002905DBBB|nr:RYamide receptor-like [Ylistrum balloti]